MTLVDTITWHANGFKNLRDGRAEMCFESLLCRVGESMDTVGQGHQMDVFSDTAFDILDRIHYQSDQNGALYLSQGSKITYFRRTFVGDTDEERRSSMAMALVGTPPVRHEMHLMAGGNKVVIKILGLDENSC